MAPARVGTPILVRIPDDMLAEIDKRRVATGQNRAEAIRKMLRHALDCAKEKR